MSPKGTMLLWQKVAAFTVHGRPKGQPRPRAFTKGGKARIYDSGTAEGWKGQIALAARRSLPELPYTEPICMRIIFNMPRPQRLMRRRDPAGPVPHTGSPDIDNLLKAVMDAFTQIGFWRDDTQVIDCAVTKQYHAKDGQPGAVITMHRLTHG